MANNTSTTNLAYITRASRSVPFYVSHGDAGLAGLMAKISVSELRSYFRKSVALHAWKTPSISEDGSFFVGRKSMAMRRAVGIAQAAHYSGLSAETIKRIIYKEAR